MRIFSDSEFGFAILGSPTGDGETHSNAGTIQPCEQAHKECHDITGQPLAKHKCRPKLLTTFSHTRSDHMLYKECKGKANQKNRENTKHTAGKEKPAQQVSRSG